MRTRTAVRSCLLGLGCALGLCCVLWQVARSPTYQLFGDLVARVPTRARVVALTFDDGPSPHNTKALLALLRRHAVRATFFVVGKNLERHPALAREMLAAGHQLGNHSYSHVRMLLRSPAFCTEEITRTDLLIRSLGYRGEIVFRPPFGKKLLALPLVLARLGKLSVTWDVEAEDTESQDPARLERTVLELAAPGSIILFHDGGRRKPGTLAAVERVIRRLRRRGFALVTVNELQRWRDRSVPPAAPR